MFQTLFSTETEETEGLDEENENIGSQSTSTSTPIFAKKRRIPEVDHAKKQMDQAVGILKSMSARSERETHEVDLYCQLLAKKIKKFDEEEREDIMHEIDDLIYKRKKNRNQTYGNRAYSSLSSVSVASPFSVLSAQPSPSSETQFSNVTYVQTQPENSVQMYSTQSHQPSGSMQSQERVNSISNDVIQKAFLMCQDQYNSQ